MDLSKYKQAFENMDYDQQSALKVCLPNTKSSIIVTQSADLDAATDFIADSFQSEDLNQIRSIFVQAAIEEKFIQLLKSKMKLLNIQLLDDAAKELLLSEYQKFFSLGLDIIQGVKQNMSGVKSAIIKCPRSMIASEDLPIVTLEVFRTTKEAISFAKSSISLGIWCENISIAFELINALPNARQIWLNASHGATHPKIPFFNGQLVCEDNDIRAKALGCSGSTVEVLDNTQFLSTFRGNSFQTIVIPFGESFAN